MNGNDNDKSDFIGDELDFFPDADECRSQCVSIGGWILFFFLPLPVPLSNFSPWKPERNSSSPSSPLAIVTSLSSDKAFGLLICKQHNATEKVHSYIQNMFNISDNLQLHAFKLNCLHARNKLNFSLQFFYNKIGIKESKSMLKTLYLSRLKTVIDDHFF